MERLYKYALWLLAKGNDLLDTVAKLSIKFASFPASVIYNAALAAFSSRAFGQHFAQNDRIPLGNLLNQVSHVPLIQGKDYGYVDLVNMFPQIVAPPYQFSGAAYVESETFNGYKTYHTYVDDNGFFHKIYNTTIGLMDYKYKIVNGKTVFITKFILGRPILVDFGQ